jgi:hypothetical protein
MGSFQLEKAPTVNRPHLSAEEFAEPSLRLWQPVAKLSKARVSPGIEKGG